MKIKAHSKINLTLDIVGKKENGYELLIKNKILLNDEIEIITPNYSTLATVEKITHSKKGEVDTANTNDVIEIQFKAENNEWEKESAWALARTKGMKDL